MQDGFNLGWKLAAVLRKRCAPHLLHSYSAERQAIAKELIDFDREWAEMLASSKQKGNGKGFDPAETQSYFVRHGRYTAGTATCYSPSLITGEATWQHLAAGLPIGMSVLATPAGPSLARLTALGVARISLGPGPMGVALAALQRAAEGILAGGELPADLAFRPPS